MINALFNAEKNTQNQYTPKDAQEILIMRKLIIQIIFFEYLINIKLVKQSDYIFI